MTYGLPTQLKMDLTTLVAVGALLPLSFPRGMDCILSWFWLSRPSLPTDIRSVSDAIP